MRTLKCAMAVAAGLMMFTATGTAMAAKNKVAEITCEKFLALGPGSSPVSCNGWRGSTEKGHRKR